MLILGIFFGLEVEGYVWISYVFDMDKLIMVMEWIVYYMVI